MYGCESWTIKKAERRRIDAFELWCWRRLLRVPWTARRSSQSILKEISPGCSLEGLMLKLQLQYFGHLMRRNGSSEKTLILGKIEGRRRRGWQEGPEFEKALGNGERQESLVCCSPWGSKESDMTEWLNKFFGRTDVEAEAPIIWPPDVKSWLIGKVPDTGKEWGQEEKGTTEDEMAGWHHWLDAHEFGLTPGVGDRQGGVLWFMGLQRIGHDWATELNWTESQYCSVSGNREAWGEGERQGRSWLVEQSGHTHLWITFVVLNGCGSLPPKQL